MLVIRIRNMMLTSAAVFAPNATCAVLNILIVSSPEAESDNEEKEGREEVALIAGTDKFALLIFSISSVSSVASTSVSAEDSKYSQDRNSPRHEGRKPSGLVARGSARNPPPMVVPAISRDDDRTRNEEIR